MLQENIVDVENSPSLVKDEIKVPCSPVKIEDVKATPYDIKTEEQLEQERQMQLEQERQDQKDVLEMMEIINKNKLERQQNQKRVEELDIYKEELETWSCICLTMDDWISTHEKYKKSKKKADQEIAKLMEQNYLPEMPALFQKAEKERIQRLLAMAPKRQSQRLQVKQQMVSEHEI